MISIETKMDKAISLLKKHYNVNVIVLIVLFFLLMFRVIPGFKEVSPVNVVLERYAILISIIAIPAALKMFADYLKKIPYNSDSNIAIGKYKKASLIRLYSISAVTLMNLVLYAISGYMNFFWLTVILLFVYLFCKPSYPELGKVVFRENVIESDLKEDIVEEDKVPDNE